MREKVTASRRFRWRLAGFLLLSLLPRAYSLDPAWATSQYLRDRWDANNGFVGGQVNAIAQTKDGYLWIGAESGLYRYDGLRFVAVPQTNPELPEIKSILGLATDDNGGLLIRMEGSSLWRYHNGILSDVLSDNTLRDKDLTKEHLGAMRQVYDGTTLFTGHVTAMTQGHDGAVLFSVTFADFNGLYRYRQGELESLISRGALGNAIVVSIAQTTDGRVWLGTRDNGLFYLENGKTISAEIGLTEEKINALLPLEDGALLIATDRGIVRRDRQKIVQIYSQSPLQSAPVIGLMKDHDGNVWVGTQHGLVRLNSSGVSRVDLDSNNEAEPITALFEGREGNVWVGCTAGFWRLRDGAFLTYSTKQGLPSASTGPIYADAMQRIWFAPMNGGVYWMKDGKVEAVTVGGLNRGVIYSIAGDKHDGLWIGRRENGLTNLTIHRGVVNVKTFKQEDGLAQNSVYTVFKSRDGTVWAGTLSGGLSALHDGKFVTYTAKDGLGANIIYSIEEARDGTIWVGTAGGLSVLSNGKWRNFGMEDGLPWDVVISLHQDGEGILWIGTIGGLAYMASGEIHSVSGADAVLKEPIAGLTEDGSGSLWIATSNHILRVNRTDLIKGHLVPGSIREYGVDDGLLHVGGARRNRSVVNDGNGRIWFSTNRGLSVVDWRKQRIVSPPVITHIDGISNDGNPVSLTSTTRIPASPRRVAIDYTGLNLSAPDRVRFQYKLEGFDRAWTESTAERQAIYTNLPPGPYRFAVKASNDDGLWNGQEASIAFSIEPALWQTWWFQLLCAVTTLFLALLFFRTRMSQITGQLNVRFNERLAERTRIARDLHDTLLQSFHGLLLRFQAVSNLLPERAVEAKQRLDNAIDEAAEAITEGRDAVQGLRSSTIEINDLAMAIRTLGEELADIETDQNSAVFEVAVEGTPRNLHPILRDEVYRIAGEAMRNAFRHAHARRIEVEIHYDQRQLRLRVRDDGKGIAPRVLREEGRAKHFGLHGMRERAKLVGGKLAVWSDADSGTEVELSVPASIAYATAPTRLRSWLSEKISGKETAMRL